MGRGWGAMEIFDAGQMNSLRPYRVIVTVRRQSVNVSFGTKEAMLAYLSKLKCDQIKAIYVGGKRQDALTTKALWLTARPEDRPAPKPPRRRPKPSLGPLPARNPRP
jgi:hypothetical protein